MDQHRRARRMLEGILGTPTTSGNHVERLRNGVEIFPAMLEAIEDARHTIDLLTFVYWTGDVADRFAEALSRRSREGVRVRVILDAFGARLLEQRWIDELEDAGVQLHWFRPVMSDGGDDHDVTDIGSRTHRKVLVVDELVGFTGGVGIAEEWEGDARDPSEWRDTHFRVEGPAVDGLRAAFLDDWMESSHPVLDDRDKFPDPHEVGDMRVMTVRGGSQTAWSDIRLLVRALTWVARERINLTSAYFSPDPAMTDWLVEAAHRGVDVRILMPGEHTDKRLPQLAGESRYPALLEAGVRVFRYQRSMLHAKVITIDGHVSVVGSANYNNRSISHDEEIDLVVFDEGLTRILDDDLEDDLAHADEVTEEDWQDRGLLQRVQERVVETFDDLV